MASAIWGFDLGVGVFTQVNSWAFWGWIALMVLAADPRLGAGAGAMFGLTRGSGPALAWFARDDRWLGQLGRNESVLLGVTTASVVVSVWMGNQ